MADGTGRDFWYRWIDLGEFYNFGFRIEEKLGRPNGAIFQLQRHKKASIPATISRRYAAGASGRRGHGRGGLRPQTRVKKLGVFIDPIIILGYVTVDYG